MGISCSYNSSMSAVSLHASMGDADALWAESYDGEVLDEALFGILASRQSDPTRRRDLEVLTRLERATKDIAEPVLARRGITPGDPSAIVASAREMADGVAHLPWDEFLALFPPITAQFLAKYRRLVELAADDEERGVAQVYVEHEMALCAFVRRTLGEEPGEPLQPILELPHIAQAAPA
jgi:hypothetical protein